MAISDDQRLEHIAALYDGGHLRPTLDDVGFLLRLIRTKDRTASGGPVGDTFTAIVLRAPRDVPTPGRKWWFFNHPEKGALVEDPVHAAHLSIGEGLWYAESEARKHYGDRDWERARLIVRVEPFSSQAVLDAMDVTIKEQVKRQAIAKLTDVERRALGL